MRLTRSLLRQHIDRMFKAHWHVQHKRKVIETGTEKLLRARNIEIVDPEGLLTEKKPRTNINVDFLIPKPLPRDNKHPNWKDIPCLSYSDHNVLLEGEKQAEILTKTIKISTELPNVTNNLLINQEDRVEKLILKAVHNACIFDAHQEVLPKLKDPSRPAWVFPRQYGITDVRRIRNLSQKIIQLCESLSGPEVAFKRNIIHNGTVNLPIEKDGNQLQFVLRADLLVSSTSPLKPIASKDNGKDIPLPDIYPIDSTISLESQNIYELKDFYPIDSGSQWMNAHTIFVHYDPTEVKNIYETPVTETQIIGRSLIKSYAIAAACARQRFGNKILSLPEPVTVQCIQSDGQFFHFSVFQLNTLDLNGRDGEKNLWTSAPRIKLFDKAGYENGVPIIRNYNPEVFKRIFAFYNNN